MNITDHALLLYIGRIEGIDVATVRADLLARCERAGRAAEAMGSGDYSIRLDGLQLIVRGDRITSVQSHKEARGRFRALRPDT